VKVVIRWRHHSTDDTARGRSGKDMVAELGNRVEQARAVLPLQADPALAQAMSFGEIEKERRFQEWMRDQIRRQRKRLAKRALASEYRKHVEAARIRQQDVADRRWHERALAAQRRATSSDALIAMLGISSIPAAAAPKRMLSRAADQTSSLIASSARDLVSTVLVDEQSIHASATSLHQAVAGVFEPREQPLDACERIARKMIEQKGAKVPEDHLVAVLRLAQAGWNANAIAIEMRRITATSIYRSTIDRHILRAKSMGLEIPVSRLEVTPLIRTAGTDSQSIPDLRCMVTGDGNRIVKAADIIQFRTVNGQEVPTRKSQTWGDP
jgi:hypothetical protein